MNEFLTNLQRQANENPIMALAVATGLLTAAGKCIDAVGRYKGSSAFARDVNRRVKKSR